MRWDWVDFVPNSNPAHRPDPFIDYPDAQVINGFVQGEGSDTLRPIRFYVFSVLGTKAFGYIVETRTFNVFTLNPEVTPPHGYKIEQT